MKHLFKIILIVLMLFSSMPAYSAEIIANPLVFQSEMLKQKYSPYELLLKNNGENPIKINNIYCTNAVNDAEKLQNSYTPTSKKFRTLNMLGPFTLGITSLIAIPVMNKDLEKVRSSSAEATKYSTAKLFSMKDVVIFPNQQISLLVAVPLNQKPIVNVVFQDTITNKYINAELTK